MLTVLETQHAHQEKRDKNTGAFTPWNATQQKELLPFATARMKLENVMLSEISQSAKDKYHMISLVRGN